MFQLVGWSHPRFPFDSGIFINQSTVKFIWSFVSHVLSIILNGFKICDYFKIYLKLLYTNSVVNINIRVRHSPDLSNQYILYNCQIICYLLSASLISHYEEGSGNNKTIIIIVVVIVVMVCIVLVAVGYILWKKNRK